MQEEATAPRDDLQDERGGSAAGASLDLTVAGVLLVAGAAAALGGAPPGVRVLLAATVLFVVPGYLLLQALFPGGTAAERARHGLLSLGISPALVGLFALAAAALPGGFQAPTLVMAVTLGGLVLLGVAALRRWRQARWSEPSDAASDSSAPDSPSRRSS